MALTAGQSLAHYEVLGPLGAGAMGEVYRARDTRLEREVAIKVLPEHFADDAERLRRFEREAKSLAALNHPNVAQIFGVDQDGGTYFLVLELVPGETLEERIARGPLSLDEALDVCGQIAEGLAAAHEARVVHRDLKPANVRITPTGQVKVLDFGLAKAADAAARDGLDTDSVLTTAAGRLLGTPTYMAPEQARGKPIDRRVDVWAFGCVLFECLTGRRAFAGESLTDVLAAVLEREPDLSRLPADTPAHVRDVLARCLAKDPRERLRDVGDAALLLAQPGAAAAGETSRAPRTALWLTLVALIAVLAFLVGRRGAGEASSTEPPRVTQLTFSGLDQQPEVSPDGRLIAFTSGRRGLSQIWLRQIDGGGEQPLTDGPDWRPRFSPDGTSVAFIRGSAGDYSAYRVPVLGGQPRKLMEDATEVDWSPDGTRLAFLRGAAVGNELSGSVAGVRDLATGEERILLRMQGYDLLGLGWSPDGARLCMTRSSIQGGAGGWRTLLVDPDSGEVEELDLVGGRGLCSAASWAGPDALVFALSDTAVTAMPLPYPIMRYDLGTRESEVLLWSPDLFPFRGSLNPTTQFSLVDDSSLLFDTFQHMQSLYEFDLEQEPPLPRRLMGGVSIDRQPCYHPDGDLLVFTTNVSGNVDLFGYRRSTGEVTQLTDSVYADWDGAFTPDGAGLLWSSDRSGVLEIWTSDLDGAHTRQVSSDGFDAENPTMTADGEWVVYSSKKPERPGIMRTRSDGSETTVLVPGNYIQPDVSPDGRYALFVSTDNARLENSLAVAEVATGRRTAFEVRLSYDLLSPNITYGRGRWMPDGKSIVFVDIDEQGRTGLSIQAFDPERDTRDTRRALLGFDGGLVYESFAISPDGRHVTVSSTTETSAIHRADLRRPVRR